MESITNLKQFFINFSFKKVLKNYYKNNNNNKVYNDNTTFSYT